MYAVLKLNKINFSNSHYNNSGIIRKVTAYSCGYDRELISRVLVRTQKIIAIDFIE